MKRIIVIGFMGAGKTTVGRILARRLKFPFFDTDQLIEQQAGMSVSRIFEVMGEEKFRSLETEVLKGSWTRGENWVLSVGGGLPMREENRRLLREIGTVVYLRVQADTVLERLAGDRSRPLLQGDNVKERVESLLGRRGALYEDAADVMVDVDGKRPEKIGEEILGRISPGKGRIRRAGRPRRRRTERGAKRGGESAAEADGTGREARRRVCGGGGRNGARSAAESLRRRRTERGAKRGGESAAEADGTGRETRRRVCGEGGRNGGANRGGENADGTGRKSWRGNRGAGG